MVISHSPFLIAATEQEELTILNFFCAVLNSSVCHWYLQTNSPKYSRGYNRVEVSVIRGIPVPDPAHVPARQLREILDLVEDASQGELSNAIEERLEELIADAYGLTPAEQAQLRGAA